ncbi:MAG: hypothetical protein ABIJ61_05965, partial [bacterium]
MLSSIGLPGTNGFVGEFLILVGTFKMNTTYAVIAASGVIFAACDMLWMYQRVMFGTCENPENQKLKDINWRERIVLVPLVILIFWIGLYPSTFLKPMEPSLNNLIEQVQNKKELISQMEQGDGFIWYAEKASVRSVDHE